MKVSQCCIALCCLICIVSMNSHAGPIGPIVPQRMTDTEKMHEIISVDRIKVLESVESAQSPEQDYIKLRIEGYAQSNLGNSDEMILRKIHLQALSDFENNVEVYQLGMIPTSSRDESYFEFTDEGVLGWGGRIPYEFDFKISPLFVGADFKQVYYIETSGDQRVTFSVEYKDGRWKVSKLEKKSMIVRTSEELSEKLFQSYPSSFSPDIVQTEFSCFAPLRGQVQAVKTVCYQVDNFENTAIKVPQQLSDQLLAEVDQARGKRESSHFKLQIRCMTPGEWNPEVEQRGCQVL